MHSCAEESGDNVRKVMASVASLCAVLAMAMTDFDTCTYTAKWKFKFLPHASSIL